MSVQHPVLDSNSQPLAHQSSPKTTLFLQSWIRTHNLLQHQSSPKTTRPLFPLFLFTIFLHLFCGHSLSRQKVQLFASKVFFYLAALLKKTFFCFSSRWRGPGSVNGSGFVRRREDGLRLQRIATRSQMPKHEQDQRNHQSDKVSQKYGVDASDQ